MKKADIERMVTSKVRQAAEQAAAEAMSELNTMGHCFEPTHEGSLEWAEPRAKESLSITCAIGVGFTARSKRKQEVDPVVQSFIARAESGTDQDASLLNMLEGDLVNGGFQQLYENKGEEFMRKGVVLLRRIGARSAPRLVERALMLIHEQQDTIKNCNKLRRDLDRLDARFYRLKENIAALYERHRQRGEP